MHGIVSLLDTEHEARVVALWEELHSELGLGTVRKTLFPHLSYQGALGYDADALEAPLRAVAREQAPFTVNVDGLGVFTGPAPVLYLAVLRTPELAAFQCRVWDAAVPAANGADQNFQPETWIPHITLAINDLDAERLAQAVRVLGTRPLRWRISVDNVAYGEEDGEQTHVRWRMPLGA